MASVVSEVLWTWVHRIALGRVRMIAKRTKVVVVAVVTAAAVRARARLWTKAPKG